MVTKDNLLICSVRWSEDSSGFKNSFYTPVEQYNNTGLTYKIFQYEKEPEMEALFIQRYGWLGEYIYYRVFKLYESLRKEIKENNYDYILFIDYNDTMFVGNARELLMKLNQVKSATLLGGEITKFPDEKITDLWPNPITFGEGPHLNAGMLFSKSLDLLIILRDAKELIETQHIPYTSCQGVWQIMYHSNKYDIQIDKDNEIFYNLYGRELNRDYGIMKNHRLVISNSTVCPLFIHQNGWPHTRGLIDLFGEPFKEYNESKKKLSSTKLSIVTSYYNCEKFIMEQAKSILSQTYTNWEWIICDDFSTDRTKEKLIELAKIDSRIKLVEQKYKKEIWWNPQIHATGNIVCPIDGDDKILPKTFEKIVYYFNKFPDVVLLHFNANKYNDVLPQKKEDIIDKFLDNVYISRDNISFLDAFERLWSQRSCIFGYLRIFRNLPELNFKVHPDGDACSSNDGQWFLYLEERGKCLAIPRTTYIARNHGNSENYRNWNIRGEANLVTDTQKRRQGMDLEMPRISDYFNEVYVAAESTYLSQLNWETESKKVCFFNYQYSERQKLKLRELFFDHEIFFDGDDKMYDYCFIRIRQDSVESDIMDIMEKVSGRVNLYCDNVHLHYNNRTNRNTLNEIKDSISKKYSFYWNVQENRAILYLFDPIKLEMIEKKDDKIMDDILLKGYEEVPLVVKEAKAVENECFFTFIDGPRVTINGAKDAEYLVKFIDLDTQKEVFTSIITTNHWTACSVQYCMSWVIEVYENNVLWKTHKFDPTGKRVYIHLDSNSLGDTLAWAPYAEEFRKKWNCTVILSTHRNYFFEEQYPEIELAKPGAVVHNLYASFGIGWYYNQQGNVEIYKNPYDFKSYPLQQTATDILNMDFEEIKPKLKIKDRGRKIPGKRPYVCIAPHASALAKYWNLPGGWQGLINYIREKGYDVVMITQEKLGNPWDDGKLGGKLTGVIDKTGDKPLEERINDIKHAAAFIGVGSGLSWLAWAIDTPVLMISGFSEEWTEFTKNCVRVVNETGCRGCFNRARLDAADWRWCPDHKDTDRQFECTKLISLEQVIDSFNKLEIKK